MTDDTIPTGLAGLAAREAASSEDYRFAMSPEHAHNRAEWPSTATQAPDASPSWDGAVTGAQGREQEEQP